MAVGFINDATYSTEHREGQMCVVDGLNALLVPHSAAKGRRLELFRAAIDSDAIE